MGLFCSKDMRSISAALCKCRRAHDDPSTKGQEVQAHCMRVAEMLALRTRGTSFRDRYERQETVSYGASSTVSRGRDRSTGETVAIKVIPKSGRKSPCQGAGAAPRGQRQRVLAEVAAMMAVVGHKSSASLREVFEDDRHFYLVLDYYSGGELFDHIVRQRSGFTERQAAAYMRDLMEWLEFSHGRGLVHADVKPENIMLSSEGAEATVKVIDFGLSFFARPGESCRNVFGTVNYCSPEMAHDATGQKTDVWSAGVMLFFMLSGKAPFKYRNREATMCRLRSAPRVTFSSEVWDRVSDEAKDFIRALLEPDPDKRPSASQALEMSWLRDLSVSSRSHYQLDARTVQALRTFTERSRACRILLEAVARNLPRSEVADQMCMFSELDADNNGVVDYEELRLAVQKVHPELGDQEVRCLFRGIDVDDSGHIDMTEFVAATIPSLTPKRQEELIRTSFLRLDRTGSGFIPKEELMHALCQGLGRDQNSCEQAEIETQLEAMDSNKDGKISVEEFQCAVVDQDMRLFSGEQSWVAS
eukprot:evm.model.scf_1339.1 EVM.evm.TU.scf_1339.1   scf_1339:13547-16997(+)